MNNLKRFFTVTEFNSLIKEILENTLAYSVPVRGEISSFKVYPSAVYFDIKDDKSVLNCIMWASNYSSLSFRPKIGDLVELEGNINVYVQRGRYSFIARTMRPAGLGEALLRLEELKKKLAAEGLFDETKKRKIPEFPKNIGIISARDSAALSDLIKNIDRRWPLASIYFFPSLVQGKDAPKSLLAAYKRSQSYPLDTLIIARGGGSNEDLSAFNDEALVRAVSQSKMPTISAVGHEIDITLIDYVADKRVSTPTGAAEAATPNQDDIRAQIAEDEGRITHCLSNRISQSEEKVRLLSSRSFFLKPNEVFTPIQDKINGFKKTIDGTIASLVELNQQKVDSLNKHLNAVNPLGVLNRGYSITLGAEGKAIKSIDEVKPGQKLKTYVNDGIIVSEVKESEHGK